MIGTMPRPPKTPHVLRTTLKILGLTQKQFAERLGIASVTLEKFLNGDTAISENLASRISAETGVDFAQLLTNSEPENPRSLDGSPLSQDPKTARRALKALSPKARLAWAVRITKQLVAASLQASVESEVFDYQSRLRFEIVELLKELNLTAKTKELLGLKEEESLIFSSHRFAPKRRSRAKSPRKVKPAIL